MIYEADGIGGTVPLYTMVMDKIKIDKFYNKRIWKRCRDVT